MGTLFRRIAAEWLRRSGVDPLFVVKMHVNELVIREVAKAAHGGDGLDQCNEAAAAMAESPVHVKIGELARAVVDEIKRQSAGKVAG